MSHPQDGSWPARIVIAVQLGIWFTVGALLLHMGITSLQLNRNVSNSTQHLVAEPCHNGTANMRASGGSTALTDTDNASSNESDVSGSSSNPTVMLPPIVMTTEDAQTPLVSTSFIRGAMDTRGRPYKPSAIVMIAIGCTMLIIGPFVLIFRECEDKRQKKRFTKPDPPPSYDEVAERAPRYSMLFDVNEMDEVIPINNTHPSDQEHRNGDV